MVVSYRFNLGATQGCSRVNYYLESETLTLICKKWYRITRALGFNQIHQMFVAFFRRFVASS